jgi:lysophospholipase L1-like esterase
MSPRTLILSLCLSTTAAISFAGDFPINWPIPTPPPGQNPATFPVARNEWLDRFKTILDQTKAGNIDLLFDGDSITAGWLGHTDLWKTHFPGRKVATFGIGGDRTENVLWRLQNGEAAGLNPKLIVLLIGTNNIFLTPQQIFEGVAADVKQYRLTCPQSHLLLLGVFPREPLPSHPFRAKILALNKLLATLDDGKDVTFFDFGNQFLNPDGALPASLMPDYLHPNEAGYEIWIKAIQPFVDKYDPAP